MKKALLSLLICLVAGIAHADGIFFEGFEYANHDMQTPVGWSCDDQSWLCGYLAKDHNRVPHNGNWYAFTNADESWMFMPLYMGTELKYRFSCWAISDGSYTLEFWGGNTASPEGMQQLFIQTDVSNGFYEKLSVYIEHIQANYQYFGIHAVADEGASHLTIDDINVDMVEKYSFLANPSEGHVELYPGQQTEYTFKVYNTGYEPIDVIFAPSHEYFPHTTFYVDGNACTRCHVEPDGIAIVTVAATLSSTVLPGDPCWLDIMLVLDCNCATAMTTLWVTVLDELGTEKHVVESKLFPNPVNDVLNIETEGLVRVDIADAMGRNILSIPANGDKLRVDMSSLSAGIYFVTTTTTSGSLTEKIVK